MSNYDWDDVDSGAQDAVQMTFPNLFWRNGESKLEELGKDNINYCGGFFFTYEQAGEGVEIKNWKEASFSAKGKKLTGLAAHKAMVSFVRSRRRWFQEMKDGRKEYRAWNQYQPGDRAQMQVIGFIKGFPNAVCFPFKGLSVSNVDSIIKEHHSKIVTVANRESPDPKKGMPSYAFWTVVEAGPHEEVGKTTKSEATMPRIVLPKTIDAETVRQLYVGRDILKQSQELYRLAEDWAHQWEKPGTAQGSNELTNREVAEHLQNPKVQAAAAAAGDPYEGGTFKEEDDIPF